MSSKLLRQNKIKEILQKFHVDSQEELVGLLRQEGIEITQATLSRDFSDLGVIRVRAEEGSRYVISHTETGSQVYRLIRYEILAVGSNENCLVVRTLAGRAQGVGHFIDRLNKTEILGTIAGDDTILVIPASVRYIPDLVRFFNSLMDEGEENSKA